MAPKLTGSGQAYRRIRLLAIQDLRQVRVQVALSSRPNPRSVVRRTSSRLEAGVRAERWRCIKIRPRRCLRGRGRDCQIARRTHDNRAPSRRSGRHAVPGSAVSVLRSWHAFSTARLLCLAAPTRGRPRRRHLQRISPSLLPRSGGVERTRAVHGSCRDVGVGDCRNARVAMPA
jgi:hypothetical protein